MLYLFVALFFFFDAVLIHLLVCRKAKEEGLFLKIFIMIAGVNLFICWLGFIYLMRSVHGSSSLWFVPLTATSTAIYLLLIPTYLIFYFSTQQTSPSKKIMMLLSGCDMSLNDLAGHFTDEELIEPRIRDLLTTNCIVENNGTFSLTPAAVQMARMYALYQAVLGRKKGG